MVLFFKRLTFLFWVIAILQSPIALSSTVAADTVYIPVGEAKAKKTHLTILPFEFEWMRPATKTTPAQSLPDREGLTIHVPRTIMNDLAFMDLFEFVTYSPPPEKSSSPSVMAPKEVPPTQTPNPKAQSAPETSASAMAQLEEKKEAAILPEPSPVSAPKPNPWGIDFEHWKSKGVEFLVWGKITREGINFTLHGRLFDVKKAEVVFSEEFVAEVKNKEDVAHDFANLIVNRLTGLPGIFQTKIAMACDRSGKKEIYVMDFDGSNVKRITHHHSISFAPAWSPDGSRIAYSVYNRHRNNIKNIDLYEFNFKTNRIRMLSQKKGINSGAAYSPDGTSIALTMSYLGNPELFLLNPNNRRIKRITHSFGFDVDPSWSPDGKKLAFVSSRTGKPMVFTMDLHSDKDKPKRLTIAGRYNASPTWSPKSDKIAFAGWYHGTFDIFTMNADGTNIERLTKDQGSNEDPFFSPDGTFLAFSSDRTGKKNIYVMNIDGTFVKRLTYGLGNCVSPKWSQPPKQSTLRVRVEP